MSSYYQTESEDKIPAGQVDMNDLLQLTVDEGASDLHISVGLPPMLRLHGHGGHRAVDEEHHLP